MYTPSANPSDYAEQYIGFHEYRNREQLQEILRIDPVRTEWCADFVNGILTLDGKPNLYDIEHPYPLTARAFLKWGYSVSPSDIQRGDLVVFPRGNQGWQGHVGFYIASKLVNDKEYYVILGGNQSNQVSYELYKASDALDIRRWIE